MLNWEERVNYVAREIEQHLKSHPHAADSLEGIATWWISKQRIRQELNVVRAALEKLNHAGIISPGQATNKHDPVYQLNKKY